VNKVLYRYEIEYQSEGGPTSVQLRELPVVRETGKTYFIKKNWFDEKRVPKGALNAYAHDTRVAAHRHFTHRTTKRIAWFEFWTKECEKALKLIEDM
jgi:hypothetical protein